MTKTRTTKRALFTSAISLLLCVVMLVGSTFAWFTDSASTGVNSIKAGNLDLKLSYSKDMEDNWTEVDADTKVFKDNELWEPGRTQVAYFKIENTGSLAFEYKIGTNVKKEITGATLDGSIIKLSDHLQFGIVTVEEGEAFANSAEARAAIKDPMTFKSYATDLGVLGAGTSQTFAMVVWMPEDVGNDANHNGKDIPEIQFGIEVNATQTPAEADSFGTNYDEAAALDEVNGDGEIKNAVVATAEDLEAILNRTTDAGSGNATVTITDDIKLEGKWTPVEIDGYNGAGVITINGNGKTISGLTAPLFAGGFAGASGIVIKNLTIADSNIVSTNGEGSGAFIETIDSMQTITLENCHVKNSTITGSRTGGLIGWNSGYNNTNDGAVKTYVTIKGCSVVNCDITGAGSVGGIVGHAGANAWTWNTIENCVVEDCTLTSNDDSYRVGAIVGTANVGEVTIKNCTSKNNTIKQNNNGSEIACPAGQSDLYGRFVPGTTGKLTIDGTEIK